VNYAKTIYWLPRALSVAFALFIGVFALDVFEEYAGWEAALALIAGPAALVGILFFLGWLRKKRG
jgi:hypothetical protein